MSPASNPPPISCTRCGQPHTTHRGGPACTGHVDQPDQPLRPCRNSPRKGQKVCDSHGGNAPQNVAAAKRRLDEQTARRTMATYGMPVDDVHWTEALAEELRWSVAHVRWLRDRIQDLEPEALVWGVADELDKGSGEFPGVDMRKAAAPSVWLELYHRERRFLLDLVKAMGATDAVDRQLRLAERQADAVVAVLKGVLDGLGLSPEQAALVPGLVERGFRALMPPAALEGRVVA